MTGWKTRFLALKILIFTERENFKRFKPFLDKYTKDLPPLDRAFVREIASGTVRFLRLLDFSIEKATGKNPAKQKIPTRNALRLTAYQLFFTGIPPYAAINETVEAFKRIAGKKAAGFINAVSKKLINFDYKSAVNEIRDPIERLAVFHSFETWMVKRWHNFYGQNLERLLESLNEVAPLYLRVNALKINVGEFLKLLEDKGFGFEQHPFLKEMVRIKGRVAVEELPGYESGFFYIQDPASYLAAYLLQPKPGERILDVGAAPGGKTTAIAALTGNEMEIYAVDVSKSRMELLKENCKKLGVKNVKPVITDISKDRSFIEKHKNSFDRILIDAPCSATGVIRRHPEGKWNKSLSLIKTNASIQRELIKSAVKLLKPGGVLLFSVCSLEKEEGEAHVALFKNLNLKPQPFEEVKNFLYPDSNVLRVFPYRDGMDGFFYTRWNV
ncbi:16S rRNA (cytosine(967)-C(5))-methyltransferase RsmB [Desulfurobacterium pacificum]|uniref:16S rRNA (cytosine(967)-C(5))-methyltransferase RsmB n=1 Tax=Desulfurobacterium pacificum TaxID=240166 RepID=UPI0024B7F4A7|nr:16S rRNA (cytosine(967)-C(5))-methyltransferase RsmB [Desulfurobacterium pacificum]